MTSTSVVRGMYSADRPRNDAWLLADLALWRSLYVDHEDTQWLAAAIPEDEDLKLHGHPASDRLVIPKDFTWLEEVETERLKAIFLASISRAAEESTARDSSIETIIILISTHGTIDGKTGMALSIISIRKKLYLTPEEIFDCLEASGTSANVTIIVNTCHAGGWVEYSQKRTLSRARVTVVARCETAREIISFKRSNSGKHRGGVFSSFGVENVYKEHGISFPRPTEAFPESTIAITDDKHHPQNFHQDKILPFIASIQIDISKLDEIEQIPQLGLNRDGLRELAARELLGVPGTSLSLVITETVPPNPTCFTGAEIESIIKEGGSSVQYMTAGITRDAEIIELLRLYDQIPNLPENATSNIFVEDTRRDIENGQANKDDTEDLRSCLRRRIAAYNTAKRTARQMGMALAGTLFPLTKSETKILICSMQFFSQMIDDETTSAWLIPLQLFILSFRNYPQNSLEFIFETCC